jgi:hypothetical protein
MLSRKNWLERYCPAGHNAGELLKRSPEVVQ